MMKKTIIISIVGTVLTASANAFITWNVQNVGSDLHIWTTGSIDLSGFVGDVSKGNSEGIGAHGMIARDKGNHYYSDPKFTFTDQGVVNLFIEDVYSPGNQLSFGTWSNYHGGSVMWDKSINNPGADYTPTVDYTITNKHVADLWGTFLDDYAAHEIADLGQNDQGNERGKVFVQQIPEPSSSALLSLGALGLLIRRRH